MALVDQEALDQLVASARAASDRIGDVSSPAGALLAAIGRSDDAGALASILSQVEDRLEELGNDLANRAESARTIERIFESIPFLSAPAFVFADRHVPDDRAGAPPDTFDPGVVRVHQLFALVGVLTPEAQELLGELAGGEPVPPHYVIDEWLWEEFPELAERRTGIADELEMALDRRAELETERSDPTTTPSTYDWLSDARLADELAELDDQIEQLLDDWQVDPAHIEKFLSPMSPDQRESLLSSILTVTALAGEIRPEFGPYVDVELARIRTEYAIALYMGGTETDPAQMYMDRVTYGVPADHLAPASTRELADTIRRLDPQSPDVLSAFLNGLIVGDLVDSDYAGGSVFAHLIGQIISGELVFGDVRDLTGGLVEHRPGDAALAGVGLLPLLGSIRHIDEALSAVRQINRAARAFRRADPAGTYVRALGVSRQGRRLAVEVLDDIGRHGFSNVALDNGVAALATLMSRDELIATLRELRRLDSERLRMVTEIDNLLAGGTVPQNAAGAIRRTRNTLDKKLSTDDLVGAIRDLNGLPVYRVRNGLSSLTRVAHDEDVAQAFSSIRNMLKALDDYEVSAARLAADLRTLVADIDRLQVVYP